MKDLIEAIRAAVADGATPDQKAIGAHACRTIMTALDAEPGKPIVLPGTPTPPPLSGLSLDQVLDLTIARLSTVVAARESEAAQPVPPRPGLQIAMAPTRAALAPAVPRPNRRRP